MQRRVIAAVAAVLLAGIGAFLLYNYVNNADKRAMAGQEATQVLVVTKVVPAGTTAESIAPYLETRQLPKVAVVGDALANTADVLGLVTTTDLQVGEQVLRSRFAEPGTSITGQVKVPDNKQEVSITLEPQRVVGSTIAAGDKVAIFFTVEGETRMVLNDVLVTNIQGGLDPAATDEGAAPSGSLVVTFALEPKDAERVVFIGETAKLWLAREGKDTANQDTNGVNVKNVFK